MHHGGPENIQGIIAVLLLEVKKTVTQYKRFIAPPCIYIVIHILRIFIKGIPVIGIEMHPGNAFGDLDRGGAGWILVILKIPAISRKSGIIILIYELLSVTDLPHGIEPDAKQPTKAIYIMNGIPAR